MEVPHHPETAQERRGIGPRIRVQPRDCFGARLLSCGGCYFTPRFRLRRFKLVVAYFSLPWLPATMFLSVAVAGPALKRRDVREDARRAPGPSSGRWTARGVPSSVPSCLGVLASMRCFRLKSFGGGAAETRGSFGQRKPKAGRIAILPAFGRLPLGASFHYWKPHVRAAVSFRSLQAPRSVARRRAPGSPPWASPTRTKTSEDQLTVHTIRAEHQDRSGEPNTLPEGATPTPHGSAPFDFLANGRTSPGV